MGTRSETPNNIYTVTHTYQYITLSTAICQHEPEYKRLPSAVFPGGPSMNRDSAVGDHPTPTEDKCDTCVYKGF